MIDNRGEFLWRFDEFFGFPPTHIVRAPGRVNLIGEHTDYNGGYVLPMAIDMSVKIAMKPRADDIVRAYSIDFNEERMFGTDSLMFEGGWTEYMKGVADELLKAGYFLRGFDALIMSELPIGAGLSSSAAIEVATALCFSVSSNFEIAPHENAQIGQKAENNWIGMRCGIMDQMASACGKRGHALLIDCLTLDTEPLRLPRGTAVAIMDTATRHELAGSAYNDRRASCEKACEFFGVKFLRYVTPERLESQGQTLMTLDNETYARAKHIVEENVRVLAAAEAARQGDAVSFGALMNESHYSLRDDYEVSCEELDIMSELARNHPACFGARMTGGGFGGCAVALISELDAENFAHDIVEGYSYATGKAPQIYLCRAEDGGSAEEV